MQLILCQLDVGGWWKEKGTRPTDFAHFALFRPIQKRSFNLLCVLDPNSSHFGCLIGSFIFQPLWFPLHLLLRVRIG